MMKYYHKATLIGILILALSLRLYRLAQVPVGLHGDEMGAGYNAYALLKTGVDEYGNSWPVSFRENISPLNFYLMIPFVALLGPTDLAVRLPGVVWGMATILVTYFLVKELFGKRYELGLISTGLLTISPWHVQVSRIAHDAGLGLLVQITAVWLFLKGLKQQRWLPVAFLMFGLSLYAYHAPKVTSPLLIIVLLWLWRKRVNWLKVRRGLVLFGLISLPMVISMLTTPLSDNRLVGVSILVREATLRPGLEQAKNLPVIGRLIFYNPVTIYGLAFARQYFNYLSWDWLFFDTSTTRYFNVRNVGLMYLVELPFLLIGIYRLVITRGRKTKLALMWLLTAPVAGAVTLGEPNAGRAILMLPMLQVTTAVGMIAVIRYWRVKPMLIIALLVINLIWFGQQYFIQAPREFARQWAGGSQEAAELALKYEDQVGQIIFTDAYKQSYIYVLFYAHPEPEWLQDQPKHRRENLGYDRIGKYEFRPVNWVSDSQLKNSLLVGTGKEIPETAGGIVDEINDLQSQVLWRVVRTQ